MNDGVHANPRSFVLLASSLREKQTTTCLQMLKADGATAFILDTSKITVGTVTVDGERARWVQHRRHSVYGSALDIRLPGEYAKGQFLQVPVLL